MAGAAVNAYALRPGDDGARLPPHSLEMEQGLLGSILLNNSTMEAVAPHIRAEDFAEEVHRRIFEVAANMIGAGQAATPLTMTPFLGDHDVGGGETMPKYLIRLASYEAVPLSARTFASAVHDLAVRRRMIDVAAELVERAHDLPVQVRPSQIAGEAVELLSKLAGEEGARSTRRDAHVSADSVLASIRRAAAGEGGDRTVSTGFADLDRATGGYRGGDLWIVGARPGVGKTVFAVSSANRVARRGWGAKLFSLEVAEPQIMARLLADLTYSAADPIAFSDILRAQAKAGVLTEAHFDRLERGREMLAERPLVLDVASRLSPGEIRIRVRAERQRMAARGIELKVVFIDYLKQVAASDRYKGNRVQEIGEISYSLKQLAKDEDVCVVLLAQLNRALENREDKRPVLADIRDSGDLEADADVVAFLHREAHHIQASEAYKANDPEALSRFLDVKSDAEVILGKNRAGPTVTVPLWCSMASSTMSDHVRG